MFWVCLCLISFLFVCFRDAMHVCVFVPVPPRSSAKSVASLSERAAASSTVGDLCCWRSCLVSRHPGSKSIFSSLSLQLIRFVAYDSEHYPCRRTQYQTFVPYHLVFPVTTPTSAGNPNFGFLLHKGNRKGLYLRVCVTGFVQLSKTGCVSWVSTSRDVALSLLSSI